jgi:hypothetical protein
MRQITSASTRARIALAAICLFAVVPAAAFAAVRISSQSVSRDGIKATVTYQKGRYADMDKNVQIAISQSGVASFKQSVDAVLCGKQCYVQPKHALAIANLEGQGHADDVVLSLYSGGAHCCFIDEVYSRGPQGYERSQFDFGNPGAALKQIGPHKTSQFVTADNSFAYEFSDYAESGMPIEILGFEHGKFINVTRTHPALIAADAKSFWKGYLSDHDAGRVGVIAAWAADEYNLGQAKHAQATLNAQVKDGRIPHTFVSKLERFLLKHHY